MITGSVTGFESENPLVGGTHDRSQSTIDKRRNADKIEMLSSTTPYVKNDALPESIALDLPLAGDYIRTAVQTALTRIVDHGSREDDQLARSTALLLSQPLSGAGGTE